MIRVRGTSHDWFWSLMTLGAGIAFGVWLGWYLIWIY